MKNTQYKFLNLSGIVVLLSFLIIVVFSTLVLFAQSNNSKQLKEIRKDQKIESIIRKGNIDLKKIDMNKDGKVFQDQMHWNVISDKSGQCPLCKMTLKEVTLKEAKENLKKNGFKVK